GNQDCTGYYLNRRFYFLGKWIRHAGYFPSWNLRLFKRGHGRYEQLPDSSRTSGDNEVHEHVILQGKAAFLVTPMEHYAYPDIHTFIEKHNRYSNWEARQGAKYLQSISGQHGISSALRLRRALKRIVRYAPFPHWARFWYHYAVRAGFLDGWPGYVFCHLLAEYEFLIW